MARRSRQSLGRTQQGNLSFAKLQVELFGDFETYIGSSRRASVGKSATLSKPTIRLLIRRACREIRNHRSLRMRAAKRLDGPISLQVVFLSVQKIRRLNREFRGRDYATDILAFAPAESTSLGELVICFPVMIRQARQHGHSVQHELYYMLLHGILHLLGYDHERDLKEARRMFKIQDDCWNEFR